MMMWSSLNDCFLLYTGNMINGHRHIDRLYVRLIEKYRSVAVSLSDIWILFDHLFVGAF